MNLIRSVGNDIDFILNDFIFFIKKKLFIGNYRNSIIFTLISILNISMFLSLKTNVNRLVFFIVFSLFLINIYCMFLYICLPFFENLAFKLFKNVTKREFSKLFPYTLTPFMFLFPISFIFMGSFLENIYFGIICVLSFVLIVKLMMVLYKKNFTEIILLLITSFAFIFITCFLVFYFSIILFSFL
ncbi:MAG: hypothetical protein M0Q02_04115 [Candidatus Muirbacterium halophilum]|nr:hypothetical protein [Candidatus Muirbacterium halophilum]